jgi:hypothetical protein
MPIGTNRAYSKDRYNYTKLKFCIIEGSIKAKKVSFNAWQKDFCRLRH